MGTSAFIGLGANLGDAASSIRTAISDLGSLPGTGLQQASRLYSTPAWGLNAQPDFVNAVVRLETELPARQLLDELFVIEARHGRDRSREQRWGPRMLDLDLLLYGDTRIDEEGLQVPHPLMHLRGFVLLPLLEIAGNIEIPGHGKAADWLASLGKEALSNIVALSVDNRQP